MKCGRLAPGVILLSMFLVGCGDDAEGYSLPDDVVAVPLFDGRVIAQDAIRGAASGIAVEGDRIVMVDMFADSAIVVLDTAGNLVGRYGPRGDGPTEVRMLTQATISRDTAWFWDPRLSRLYSLPLQGPDVDLRSFSLPAPPSGGGITRAFVRDGSVVGTGAGYVGLYYEWTASEGLASVDSVGRWIGSLSKMLRDLSEEQRVHANQSFSAVSPDGTRLAIGSLTTGEFLIADLDTGVRITEKRLGEWPVKWETIQVGPGWTFEPTKESLIGYVNVKESGPRVLGLFVGKSYAEASLEMSFDARDVHVFDWDGNLQAVYRLDRPVTDIELRGNKLYGVAVEPIPKIIVWDLPKPVPDIDCFATPESERTCRASNGAAVQKS